ncbi:MAG: glutathione S-transferase family protein [Geminicoccaceae bacterium]
MKIYDVAAFPNPVRVRIALAEKNATDQVEFVDVDVMAGEHKKAPFLSKNPGGAVPVLELEDGSCISECTAITEYIDHAFEGPSLTGKTPKDRATIHMMQRRAETNLLDAVATYFHHATPGLGPDIEGYQNKEWGEKQKEKALSGMRYFDELLGAQPYIAGGDFSMADITAFAGLAFADFANIDIPDDCRNLKSWREKVAARPSIAN